MGARPSDVRTGRVVAIADAAHATTPHLGQGANLALLDAEALADALELDAPLPARLEAYARSRRWQTRRYALLSRGLSPFFQSDLSCLAPARDLALPVMTAVPPLRSFMERVLAGRG
jgi:2-polyprenyl-6-methoxyphenol hydroxylase-like FAD-dependent oxidoreductase